MMKKKIIKNFCLIKIKVVYLQQKLKKGKRTATLNSNELVIRVAFIVFRKKYGAQFN